MAPASPLKAPFDRGFTLVELVTVIILVGVLSALALPRFVGTGDFSRRAAVDQVLSGIRYAQQQAMSRGFPVRFRYQGNTYFVEYDDGSGFTQVPGTSRWSLPGNVRFANPPDSLVFNGLGALSNDPTCTNASVPLAGRSITVECLTGFAHAS